MEEATIRTKYKVLKVMLRENVNVENPEQVKLYIARRKQWSNGHKIIACYAYNDLGVACAPPPTFQANRRSLSCYSQVA